MIIAKEGTSNTILIKNTSEQVCAIEEKKVEQISRVQGKSRAKIWDKICRLHESKVHHSLNNSTRNKSSLHAKQNKRKKGTKYRQYGTNSEYKQSLKSGIK
jgi:hypothetical protein